MSAEVNIFVINLAFDKARRSFMESQLNKLNLPFTIVGATIGRDLTQAEQAAIYDEDLSIKENGYTLSCTQIACADSHRRIYEKIVNENIPWALVLEDDVRLHPDLRQILTNKFVENANADWIQIDYVPADFSYLYNWIIQAWKQPVPTHIKFFRTVLRFPAIVLWSLFERLRNILIKVPKATWFGRPLYLASAYIITNAGAKKLIPLTHPIRFAADSIQNVAPTKVGLRVVGVVPLLTTQLRQQFSSNLTYDS